MTLDMSLPSIICHAPSTRMIAGDYTRVHAVRNIYIMKVCSLMYPIPFYAIHTSTRKRKRPLRTETKTNLLFTLPAEREMEREGNVNDDVPKCINVQYVRATRKYTYMYTCTRTSTSTRTKYTNTYTHTYICARTM